MSIAWPALVRPAPRKVAIASLAPATTGRSRGRPSSAAGPDRSRPDDGAGPRRRGRDPLVEAGPARASSGVIASDGILERGRGHAREAIRDVIPGREEPGRAVDDLRAKGRQEAGAAQQADDPALPSYRCRGRGSLGGRAPVEPGEGGRKGAPVGGGGDERRSLAHDAERHRLGGPDHRRLGLGDADRPDEGGPPGVRPLLGSPGRPVDEERIGDPGEPPQAPVGSEHAGLDGRGAEVDGHEHAGISGHGGTW